MNNPDPVYCTYRPHFLWAPKWEAHVSLAGRHHDFALTAARPVAVASAGIGWPRLYQEASR